MARPALARLTSQYQITVPKAAREALGLRSGDFLEATVTPDGVLLRPKVLTDRPLAQFKKDIERSKAEVAAGQVVGPFTGSKQVARALKLRPARAHARRPK